MDGLRGITAPLWPIRYKPLPDELLSSWLVRLAHGHGLKVQTFCNLIFGNRHQVWNRDVDRLAPPWLVETLARQTGTPIDVAYGTTLKVYDGILFHNPRPSGHLNWVQSLKIYHRVREGFGQQFCPACLAEDEAPYFRKAWRLSISTVCTRHSRMLHDRCHECGAAVSFFRMDIGIAASDAADDAISVTRCHECRVDLAAAPAEAPLVIEPFAFARVAAIAASIQDCIRAKRGMLSVGELDVLRHLCTLMLSTRGTLALRAYMVDVHGVADPVALGAKRIPLESLPTETRHVLLQCAAWLLNDLPGRLGAAVRSGALRYNHLLRDFDNPPLWYRSVVMSAIPHRNPPGRVKVSRSPGEADVNTANARPARRRSSIV